MSSAMPPPLRGAELALLFNHIWNLFLSQMSLSEAMYALRSICSCACISVGNDIGHRFSAQGAFLFRH
jgi:hypothetical protein